MDKKVLLEKAKQANSPEELLALAKENGYPLDEEGAKAYFEKIHKSGELSDDELDNVAGGGCSIDNSITPQERLRQTYNNANVLCNTASCPVCGSNRGIVKKTRVDNKALEFWCYVYCRTHQSQMIVSTDIPERDLVLE